jgi:hypothetical protein
VVNEEPFTHLSDAFAAPAAVVRTMLAGLAGAMFTPHGLAAAERCAYESVDDVAGHTQFHVVEVFADAAPPESVGRLAVIADGDYGTFCDRCPDGYVINHITTEGYAPPEAI